MTITRRSALGLAAGAGVFALGGCGPASDRGRKHADVIVAGAGLSGLHAARMLEEAGLDVLVIEANERPGGRLRTLRDLPGSPEAGGEQVGATYARVRARAAEHGLAFEDFPQGRFGELVSVNGALITAQDWPSHAVNGLPENWRQIPPHRLLFSVAGPRNPFPDVYAWMDEAAAAHDVAAADWLRAQGANDEALRLIDATLNGSDVESYSMLNLFRTLAIYQQERGLGGSQGFADGAQSLPERMAAALKREPRYGAEAITFESDDHGARVLLMTGENLRADYVICTVPFAALRHLNVEAPLSEDQRAAIDLLAYTPIVQLHLEAERAWWEEDGLAPEMWTDSPIERVFARRDSNGDPTGMLTCWIDGRGALMADDMDDAALEAMARAELARVRPASEGAARLRHVQRWTASNPYAGGAYMHWRPGEARRWAATMARPAGRLHFAGEHTGELHTGMEAAMESGERAAIEILDRAQA
ncbi:MAG: flavin monoamine oxidase family protein [Oceanicaulis sp.]